MTQPRSVDPITFEVIRSQLEYICRQMGTILRKTSYSPILYDMVDFSNALFDADGQLIGQAENCPVHLGSMHFSTKAALNRIGIENLEDGDILVTNDPFEGGSHVPDINFITPVFHKKNIVGFAASRGHWTDLGGASAGLSANSLHVVEDGLIIKPTKIFSRGRPVTAVIDLIISNTRVPEYIQGDLNAHRGALMAGSDGVRKLIDKYGKDTYQKSISMLLDYVEKRTRNAIGEIPNGQYHAEDTVARDAIHNRPLHVAVTLTVEENRILVDFEGSGSFMKGSLNSPRANTYSAVYFALKFFLDPTCPSNAGYYRPISITLPKGSWVNAEWPHSTRLCTTAASKAIADVIWQALSQAMPSKVNALNYGASVHYFAGTNRESGKYFVFGDLPPGGWGGSPKGDGLTARYNRNGNCMDLTPEIAELFFPVYCVKRELITDSGGPGKFRGGLGIRQAWQIAGSDDAVVSQAMTRTEEGPPGLQGGKPGRPGRSLLHHENTASKTIAGLTSKGNWINSYFSNFH